MNHWWQRYPVRLERELASLDEAGFSWRLDEDAKDRGRIIIHLDYNDGDYSCPILVACPVMYPRTIFTAYAPDFIDGRHKEHNRGKLCLYHDEGNAWNGEFIATVLKEQIPKILAIHRNPGIAGDFETDAGVQITGQIDYQTNSVMLLEEYSIPVNQNHGFMDLGILQGTDPNECFRGALLELYNQDKESIASALSNTNELTQGSLQGRWVRLPKPPLYFDQRVLIEAIEAWPALRKPVFNKGPDVVGLLFPIEVKKGQVEDHWLFVVRYKVAEKIPGSKHVEKKVKIANVRADVVNHETVMARVPNLYPLVHKKLTIVGVGSLGSAIAWQAARAGVGEIRVVDFDHITTGNSPRWIAGVIAAGVNKLDWIYSQLKTHYPSCKVKLEPYFIGGAHEHASIEEECAVLDRIFDDADLIIDATAELAVTNFTNDMTLSRGIPLIWATGTAGAYGGVVGRTEGDWRTPCWSCYQHHIEVGTIKLPPFEEGAAESVQKIGCFHPTFTGTGFDMDHISLMAVRLAVATLCRDHESAYPDFDWDVGVLKLRDKHGNSIPAKWKTYQLTKHPKCSEH